MVSRLLRVLSAGPLVVPIAIVGAMVVGVPAARAAANTWAGVWDTSYGTMTLTQSGSSVEGTYALEDGHVGGTVSGNVLGGRWDEAPRATAHDRGPFAFTMSADGKSFTGTWGHDDTGPYPDPWNGSCTGGDCLGNGTAPPPTTNPQPALTPRSVRPELGETTSYKAPQPGKTAKLPTPVLGPKTNTAVVEVDAANAAGTARLTPPVVGAVLTPEQQEGRRAKQAVELCLILALDQSEKDEQEDFHPAFATCLKTVLRVLERYDEIVAKRSGAPARPAQAASCGSVKPRGKRPRAAVRVRCKATATGLRVTFRRLKGGPSLRSLFGRKSRLVVGRSRFDAPAGPADRVNVTWRARSR